MYLDLPTATMARQLRGKERKESKQEKQARMEANRQAHEACAKYVPAALAIIAGVLAVLFLATRFVQ